MSESKTPRTDAKRESMRSRRISDMTELWDFAGQLERQLDEARVPLCIGQPIIQILAKEGQYLTNDGRGLIAADCLFRKDPYEELDQLRARVAELEKSLTEERSNAEVMDKSIRGEGGWQDIVRDLKKDKERLVKQRNILAPFLIHTLEDLAQFWAENPSPESAMLQERLDVVINKHCDAIDAAKGEK